MKIKKISTYLGSVALLLILILVAVFFPQIFFAVQDDYQTGEIDIMNRDVFDILAIQTSYPSDTRTRLTKLAETRFADLSVSIADQSIGVEEFYEIKESLCNQEYMYYLIATFPDTFGESLDLLSPDHVKVCNRYIIYGEDYTSGVLLMFWYIKIYLPSVNSCLELCIDSETNTIYYVDVEAFADIEYEITVSEDSNTAATMNNGMINEQSEVILMEDAIKGQEQLQLMREMFTNYVSLYYGNYYGVHQPLDAKDNGTVNMAVGDNAITLVCPLLFENENKFSISESKSLFFRAYAEVGYGKGLDISIGIPLIRQLVIE